MPIDDTYDLIGNIKGPQGPPGPQGLSGPVAVASDAAVASTISTSGESATKTALTTLSASTRQAWLYASYLKKLKTGAAVSLCVRGDSIVYGHDNVSGDVVAAPTGTLPDGSVHGATRVPLPYPAVLQSSLREVYGANVTVINQGYSGDYVKRSYDRWLLNAGADVTLYQFGINDADATYIPVEFRGNVQLFIEWLEKMLLRDIAWGSAVVFLTASKTRDWISSDVLDVYRTSLYALAARYGIPVVDTEPFTANYGIDAYSDALHMNTKGYKTLGVRLAAALIGEGPHRPFEVTSGTVLATRPSIDNCVLVNVTATASPGGGTPPEGGTPMVARPAAGVNGFVYYSFYTTAADTYVVPMAYLATDGSATVEWEAILDFGIEQGDNTSDFAVGIAADTTSRAPASVIQNLSTSGSDFNYLVSAAGLGKKPATLNAIRVATPGWHSLKVRLKRGASAGLSEATLNGLQFVSFQSLFLQKQIDTTPRVFNRLVPSSFNESADILSTTLKWATVIEEMGLPTWGVSFYGAPPLKLTVRSYGAAVVEYMLLFNLGPDLAGTDQAAVAVGASGGAGPTNIEFVSLLRATPIGATAVNANTLSRELASVQYVAATRSLQLNWKTTTASAAAKDMKKNFAITLSPL